MKDTGNTMDCGACGKPISLTAKFCGKCGAPVKRPAAAAEQDTQASSQLQATLADIPPHPEVSTNTAKEVEDLVLTLDVAPLNVEHASLLRIDLDLPGPSQQATNELQPVANHPVMINSEATAQTEAVSTVPELVSASVKPGVVVNEHETDQTLNVDTPLSKTLLAVDSEWLADREQADSQIKQLLDKHTQMLDFLSLNSQQISHLQSLPNPTEALLKQVIDRQNQLAEQLVAVKTQLSQAPSAGVLKLPEEFKLSLDKQKIELQKYFSQNITQNAANVESSHQEMLARIERLMAENTQSAKTLESNLAPLSKSVTELKTKLQALSKKVDETAAKSPKTTKSSQDDTEGSGGFIIFVIGLLCGLTVVLSSLAIYNFLSREPAPAAKSAHDAAPTAADAGHEAPAHGASAKEDSGYGASSHDKPASDSSSKAKSH
jgi:hypothetical protein